MWDFILTEQEVSSEGILEPRSLGWWDYKLEMDLH